MRVAALRSYPVKSLRGCAARALDLGARGPLGDRDFMLVDEHGRFLTQRVEPALARFSARLDGVRLALSVEGEAFEVTVPPAGERREVFIWKDRVLATDAGDEVAAWLSRQLSRPTRLVHFPTSTRRPLDPVYSPRPDAQTGFADAYPVLVTTTGSLAALNARLDRPLGMDRFRPNLVIETDEPWQEDEWKVLQVGAVVVDLVKPCSRCVVITTDQQTGERPDGSTPLTVLAALRTLPGLGAIFGQNAVHRGQGRITVGDTVTVLERQPSPFAS